MDCYSYFCRNLRTTLSYINETKPKEVFITLNHLKNTRDNSEFGDYVRNTYKKSSEPQKDAIDDVLTNYRFVEKREYPSSVTNSSKKMVVVKYELID